jgi:DNA-binding LytR/AlgR family response regulator
MRVIIIEDEAPAANRLIKLLQVLEIDLEILCQLDSIESAVRFFKTGVEADLIFMDIQLADGLSFSIFEEVQINTAIIFTTAFDQYTLKAFKVNSIDYLLKPIDQKELEKALLKYNGLTQASTISNQQSAPHGQDPISLQQQALVGFSEKILQMVQDMNSSKYKERILIKRGQQLNYLKTAQIAHGYADGKLCYAVDYSGNKHLLEINLSQLEDQLIPKQFFRINRNLLVNIDSILKVHVWLGGRLKLELLPSTNVETVVSRERVNEFKEWLGGEK